MKQRIPRVLFLLTFVVLATSVSAQMDMLPQIFRDLPPELQQGLPKSMEYDEYEVMTRNVDFFSMFMSAWVPGYALFGVDEPGLGWTIVGARVGGLGMFVTGVLRQWQDLRDFWELSSIADSPQRYRRAAGNFALVGGGIVINGLAWAFDVGAAYRIAQNRKNFVQYKYGVLAGLDGDERERREAYIRSLARQENPAVHDDLERSLRRYLDTWPESSFAAEAEYHLGTLLAMNGKDAEALIVLLRQLGVHPDPVYSPASKRTAAMLVQRNRSDWEDDRETLLELIGASRTPADAPDSPAEAADEEVTPQFERFLRHVGELDEEAFKELYVSEATSFLEENPNSPIADQVLDTKASHLAELGRMEESVITYTQLASAHPGSELWETAMLRTAITLEQELGEPEYAERFYRRLLDRRPESPEASEARARLESLD
ncbi:MAG: tetratricopeptide repeat protein [Spirochaetota bacterium]